MSQLFFFQFGALIYCNSYKNAQYLFLKLNPSLRCTGSQIVVFGLNLSKIFNNRHMGKVTNARTEREKETQRKRKRKRE